MEERALPGRGSATWMRLLRTADAAGEDMEVDMEAACLSWEEEEEERS